VRIAVVHYWLVNMRGGEKVLEAICEMFPQADIYTHAYDAKRVSPTIRAHRVRTTFIGRLPFATRRYQRYLPLMPMALEQLDLREYDLVISIESGPTKGVVVGPNARHLCLCLTPMRYVWDMYPDYLRTAGPITRLLMRPIIHWLRMWDVTAAARVDRFAGISRHVCARIQRYYHRDADLLYPPVDVDRFTCATTAGDVYLVVGQLVRYKRVDLAIDAFNRLQLPLVVIGEGEELSALKRRAGPTVQMLGWQGDEVVRQYYARCRALIFPGEEDFGIVPVEAMAAGRPVIAYARGGALDTVTDGSGILFQEQTVDALCDAVRDFERRTFDPARIRKHAEKFGRENFKEGLRAVLASMQLLPTARTD
jgi:glycosyltransferase involved in cell wall biosynthesis